MTETATAERPRLDEVFTKPAEAAPLVRMGARELTREEIELIKKTVAKGATDDELALFAHVCNRTGLDPFARQIYAIKRRQKNEAGEWVENMVFQVAIDGFRLIAERSGKYKGQTIPVFYDKGGHEREIWLDPKTPPSACKVGAYRQGAIEPLFGVAIFDEYKQTKYGGELTKMWKEKPSIMIAKCAEALALRKAFPQELSGLYIHEEMPSEDDEPIEPQLREATKSKPVTITGEQSHAAVDNDGDVVLTFGTFKNRKLSSLTRDELTKNFINPWNDEQREATAALRLGAGFVKAVRAAYAALPALTAEDIAADKVKRARARYEVLIAKRTGAGCTDDELEEIRDYEADHPAEPKGDGLTRAAEAAGITGL